MADERSLIAVRHETHGNFMETASLAQTIKRSMRASLAYRSLPDVRREALDLIATKIARVVCGDHSHKDHWDDIKGYAELALTGGKIEEGK